MWEPPVILDADSNLRVNSAICAYLDEKLTSCAGFIGYAGADAIGGDSAQSDKEG